jgi:3-ketoacyl-CoA synthase
MPRKDAARAPKQSTTVKEDSAETASQWAKQPRTWLASTVDILRGYSQRLDLTGITIRLMLSMLGFYSIYLMYCESCKDEYYELLVWLQSAIVDAATGTRGSAAGELVVLGAMVWLLTVLYMRQRPKVYLVDFKTYRHVGMGGAPHNTAGEPAGYEQFLKISRNARHLDGSQCFTERSMDFQEKILRTSCIGEASIFPHMFSDEANANPVDAGASARTRHRCAWALMC